MTRHGTFAYYLAAWVIGCFAVSLLLWIKDAFSAGSGVSASMLLTGYFFALIFGAVDALLFAFLLRRMMRWWGTHSVWIWLLAGAGLAFILMLTLAESGDIWIRQHLTLGFTFQVILMGPDALRRAGLWQVPIEGAATAMMLCLVDRAFDRPGASPEARPSAA